MQLVSFILAFSYLLVALITFFFAFKAKDNLSYESVTKVIWSNVVANGLAILTMCSYIARGELSYTLLWFFISLIALWNLGTWIANRSHFKPKPAKLTAEQKLALEHAKIIEELNKLYTPSDRLVDKDL